MRKFAAIAVSLGLVAALSACASGPVTGSDCADTGNAALVTAEGAAGGELTTSFPVPLVADESSVAAIERGDGARVPADGYVLGTLSLYNGATGEPLANPSTGQALTTLPILMPTREGYVLPFTTLLSCAGAGSRVAIVGPGTELLGADLAPGLGLKESDSVVVVADVEEVFLGRADGADQIAESGIPAVVLAPSGQPGFTFPDSAAPTEERVVVLKRGGHASTNEGDSVVVHVTSIGWQAATVSASTWTNMEPAVVALDGQDDATLPGVVKDALVGLPVGSQLLVVVPGESAVVYVVDILGITEAQ